MRPDRKLSPYRQGVRNDCEGSVSISLLQSLGAVKPAVAKQTAFSKSRLSLPDRPDKLSLQSVAVAEALESAFA